MTEEPDSSSLEFSDTSSSFLDSSLKTLFCSKQMAWLLSRGRFSKHDTKEESRKEELVTENSEDDGSSS